MTASGYVACRCVRWTDRRPARTRQNRVPTSFQATGFRQSPATTAASGWYGFVRVGPPTRLSYTRGDQGLAVGGLVGDLDAEFPVDQCFEFRVGGRQHGDCVVDASDERPDLVDGELVVSRGGEAEFAFGGEAFAFDLAHPSRDGEGVCAGVERAAVLGEPVVAVSESALGCLTSGVGGVVGLPGRPAACPPAMLHESAFPPQLVGRFPQWD